MYRNVFLLKGGFRKGGGGQSWGVPGSALRVVLVVVPRRLVAVGAVAVLLQGQRGGRQRRPHPTAAPGLPPGPPRPPTNLVPVVVGGGVGAHVPSGRGEVEGTQKASGFVGAEAFVVGFV